MQRLQTVALQRQLFLTLQFLAGRQGPQAQQEPPAQRVQTGLMAQQERQDQLVRLEQQEHKGLKAKKEIQEMLVQLVHKGRLGLPVQLEPLVLQEQMEQMGLTVPQQRLLWAPCLRVLLVLAPRLQIAVLRQQLFLTLQFLVALPELLDHKVQLVLMQALLAQIGQTMG